LRCELIEPHLAAYVDGELDGATHAEVERHLKECRSCRETVRDLRLASAVLGKWQSAEPSQDLVEVLRTRIREERVRGGAPVERRVARAAPRRRRGFGGRRLVAAAAVLVVLGAAFYVWDWMGGPSERTASQTVADIGRTTMNVRTVQDLRQASIALDGVIAEQWASPEPSVNALVQLEVVSTMMETASGAEQGRDIGTILNILGEERLAGRVRDGVTQVALGAADCFLALFTMKAAVAADAPGELDAILDEAVSLEEKGELEAALGKYRQAAASRLLALQSLIHEANLEMKLGRAAEALAALEKAYALTKPQTFNREVVEELMRRAGKAMDIQRKIGELQGELLETENAFDLLSQIGSLQVKAGNLKGAEETFGQLVRSYPGPEYEKQRLRLRLLKAWCQRETNRYSPAFDEFNRLIDEAGRVYPEVAALAQYGRAKTFHLRKRYAQAIDDYTDLANSPRTSTTCFAALEFQVGYIYLMDLGNTKQAAKVFETLSKEAYRNEPFGKLAAALVARAGN